jgi:hypothetical protein
VLAQGVLHCASVRYGSRYFLYVLKWNFEFHKRTKFSDQPRNYELVNKCVWFHKIRKFSGQLKKVLVSIR